MAQLAPIVVPALKKHTATVIWAHGLGDQGSGWLPMAENFRRRGKFEEVAFVFPNAPQIPITVNFGMRMPGWYDIVAFDDLAQQQDQPGIFRSRDYFHSLIKAEMDKGIPSNRIVLGGFSQGGSLSIFAGLCSPSPLAGIFGLSSYLLLGPSLPQLLTPQNKSANTPTPVFMGHGDVDPLVRLEWGQETAKVLRELGWTVDFRMYRGLQHSADPKEMDDLENWLGERLPSQG
ncbi:MAG: hypothetical protein LQ352_005470 [Teloschistes flavicans]|nr:MAG: hypothetical protein LQ352_005470 [Teloschistes flavicans]